MTRHLAGLVLYAMWVVIQAPPPLAAPTGASFFGLTPQFALAPDGREIVSVVTPADGPATLWVQALSGGAAKALPGTEQPSYPFWSADSRFVGFFSAGKLKKIPVGGGAVTIVCDAPTGRGGTWNSSDVIVFASGIGDPLRQVSAGGGQPVVVTTVDTSRENSHRWPYFLPDGTHFLFWAGAGSAPPALKVGSLGSRESVSIVTADTNGAFGGGHLFYGSRGGLMAQAFDPVSLQTLGDPIRVTEPLSGDAGSNVASFAVSPAGTLLYTRGTARPLILTWFDRTGKKLRTIGPPGQYTNVELYPDNDGMAIVSLTAGTPPNRDIWILRNSGPSRVTTDPAVDATPIWNGDHIVFSSQRAGPYQMYRRYLGEAFDELILKSEVATVATDVSRDGTLIVYTRTDKITGLDIWLSCPSCGDAPVPVVNTPAAEDNGVFSPDGKWIAYQSNESGRDEVYARPRPDQNSPSPVVQISKNGGTQPLWRADGKELFFLAADGSVMSAVITTQPRFAAGRLMKLFSAPVSLVVRRSYAVTADGQRFLMPVLDDSNPQVITVVPRWAGPSGT